jgi:sigma-E factor negative regulatory protein RseC
MINHTGKVVAVGGGEVSVLVERGEACGKCAGKKSCAMMTSTEQIVKIKDIDFQDYTVGEMVNVSLNTSLGLKAVLLAYVLPLLVLLLSLAVGFHLFSSELLQVAAALIPTIIYYIALYGFRRRIEQDFKLSISKP